MENILSYSKRRLALSAIKNHEVILRFWDKSLRLDIFLLHLFDHYLYPYLVNILFIPSDRRLRMVLADKVIGQVELSILLSFNDTVLEKVLAAEMR